MTVELLQANLDWGRDKSPRRDQLYASATMDEAEDHRCALCPRTISRRLAALDLRCKLILFLAPTEMPSSG